jgi:hypothetical protein
VTHPLFTKRAILSDLVSPFLVEFLNDFCYNECILPPYFQMHFLTGFAFTHLPTYLSYPTTHHLITCKKKHLKFSSWKCYLMNEVRYKLHFSLDLILSCYRTILLVCSLHFTQAMKDSWCTWLKLSVWVPLFSAPLSLSLLLSLLLRLLLLMTLEWVINEDDSSTNIYKSKSTSISELPCTRVH